MDKKYNGWTNYETWNCNLWTDGQYADRLDDNDAQSLAQIIHDDIAELLDGMEIGNNMFSDILQSSIQEINFQEIAEHYYED